MIKVALQNFGFTPFGFEPFTCGNNFRMRICFSRSHWAEARSAKHFFKPFKQTFLAPILKSLHRYVVTAIFGYSLVQKSGFNIQQILHLQANNWLCVINSPNLAASQIAHRADTTYEFRPHVEIISTG